mmetsp:Transcript_2455/g.6995  ORF Transcript_2455/g.6995 Transcript_2455/m.6995 type:complete len:271 (+) Transcript_2455:360-1172(+)
MSLSLAAWAASARSSSNCASKSAAFAPRSMDWAPALLKAAADRARYLSKVAAASLAAASSLASPLARSSEASRRACAASALNAANNDPSAARRSTSALNASAAAAAARAASSCCTKIFSRSEALSSRAWASLARLAAAFPRCSKPASFCSAAFVLFFSASSAALASSSSASAFALASSSSALTAASGAGGAGASPSWEPDAAARVAARASLFALASSLRSSMTCLRRAFSFSLSPPAAPSGAAAAGAAPASLRRLWSSSMAALPWALCCL